MNTPAKDLNAFRRDFRKNGIIKSAALAAGYAESSANMGLAAMPKSIQTYVLTRRKKLSKLAQLAHDFSSQDQENVVRGALLANVAAGKDQACKSLELLGKDKRVAMFTPESTTGVIVIQAAQIPNIDSVPSLPAVIDGSTGQ